MTFLTVDTANQDTVKLNGVSKGLDGVFIAAILLTGSAEQAERAVVETIETLGGDEISEHMVWQATVSAAVKPEMMAGEEGPRRQAWALCLRSDRISSGRWHHRRYPPDASSVLGSALVVTDDFAPSVPVSQLQWGESAHVFSVCGLERCSLLLSIGFDSGTGLFSDESRRRLAALHIVDVFVVALVWRAHRSHSDLLLNINIML